MSKKSLQDLPEAFVSNLELTQAVSRELKRGRIRRLASKVYTTNLHDTAEVIVRRNLWYLVSELVPNGILADRTALENAPSKDGSVFLITTIKNPIKLPGITIRPRVGAKALDSDRDFIGGLKLCSPARAYLENMRPSRARKGLVSRTLSRREIEEYLEEVLQLRGEGELNKLRDEAQRIAEVLGLSKEFVDLSSLIGTLLGTKNDRVESVRGIARVAGEPFDAKRLELLDQFRVALERTPPVTRIPAVAYKPDGVVLPFFEAYFSNFIEGTEFEVSEAQEIIFEGKIPSERPQDAHDILGTYQVVSDHKIMGYRPRTQTEFIERLQHIHHTIMSSRPDKGPGKFKTVKNRAGSTEFVSPELVIGTLRRGFELSQSITTPFARAVFTMFLISEVHPFLDGNGRAARACMNVELVAAGETRIIIPTVYRLDYIGGLKALTHNGRPDALVRVLDFAQRYTGSIDWSSLECSRKVLEVTNAFRDPHEAESLGIHLRIYDGFQ